MTNHSSQLNGKTILVTGGAGAIGGHLVKALARNGNSVIVLDDLSSGRAKNLPDDVKVKFVQGSILDEKLIREIFTDHRVQIIFHLAALFANQNSVEHPEADLLTNSSGTLKLLEFAHQYEVERFLYSSSSCIYGNGDFLSSADLINHLETPYAISKLSGEAYVSFYHRFHKLNTTVVRYFNSYGPRDLPGAYRSVIPNFMWRAINHQPLVITGTGQETRDFTYVDDIVEGTILAATKDTGIGQTFDIGTGTEIEILYLAEKINEIIENPTPIEYRERRGWDGILRRRANIEKAARLLGFSPKVPIKEGLQKTYEWMQSEDLAYIKW
jgi:UDP-glucose 4-epimerase